MKYIFPASVLLSAALFAIAPSAFATVPPTLGLSATGQGDQVQISVTGDPNESVLLSYNESGVGSEVQSLGSTNASGSFTITISSASYGITSGTPVTAIIGGTGGPESPTINWPNVSAANALTISPAAVVVAAGSSASVGAQNTGSGTLYVANNSNPSIANISINGTSINVTGNTQGETTATICILGASGSCPTLFVDVEQSGAGQLSLSQTSATVVPGQNLPITISGGSGNYQIANNTNSSVIAASLSGSALTLSTGDSSGSAAITVCTTDGSLCGVVEAGAGSSSSSSITFSSSAPTVSEGGTATVNIYGPSGVTFYVSSNSSPSLVQANLSGSALTLTGIAPGSSTISICASTGSCSSLTATVEATSLTNITLSQNQLSLIAGQNLNVTISGGNAPYSTSGGTSAVAQESISGSTLTVYGIANGTSSVNICSNAGGCTNLLITVSGGSAAVTTPVTTTTPAVTTTSSSGTIFTEYLVPGDQDAQVLALQKLLVSLGDMTAAPNGYFGPATKTAVLKFQAEHSISQVGTVGPSTRAALNELSNNSDASASTNISSMSLSQLQAEVQTLESELNQILSRISTLGG